METKLINQLPAEQKWNDMSLNQRINFFKERFIVHNDETIDFFARLKFNELKPSIKYKLKSYIVPNKNMLSEMGSMIKENVTPILTWDKMDYKERIDFLNLFNKTKNSIVDPSIEFEKLTKEQKIFLVNYTIFNGKNYDYTRINNLNYLPAKYKWENMNTKEKEAFFICHGLHDYYIDNNIGKRFENLSTKCKQELTTYIIPNPIINKKNTMAANREKITVKTKGNVSLSKTSNLLKRITLDKPKPNTGTGKTFHFNLKKENNKINASKINSFLNGINETEFTYIYKCMGLASHIKNMIKEYKLTKERFCEEMKINKRLYKSYVSGSRNYDLRDMSKIEALCIKLQQEQITSDNKNK